MRAIFSVLSFSICVCQVPFGGLAQETAPPVEGTELFESQVLPLLREACFDCHSHESGEANGQLMLDSWAGLSGGGTRGPAVVPGAPHSGTLLAAVLYEDEQLQMPPDGKLKDEQIELLRRWVESGAAVPDSMKSHSPEVKPAGIPTAVHHWAYQPPSVLIPDAFSSNTRIDTILHEARLSAGLEASPLADRTTLAKRLYFDLLGLPPTYEQLRKIESDDRNDKEVVSALVDELLASPHFGERWARHWMDVARYADNKGYVFQEDREYPQAYKYRDWLISAFNHDMPYDQFIRLQLAADIVSEADHHEDLPAVGFLTLGRRFLNNQQDIIDDRIDVVSRGTMGLTVGCARCHDHKYDPISQADYYAMAGVFLNSEEPGGDPWPHRLEDRKELRDSFILIRGSPGNRGDKVPRRFVSFLAKDDAPFAQGSGRKELADRIVSPSNPLTSRVIANRVWMHMMGASLVDSPSDFGLRCPEPNQLPLLDYLALRLIENGWSLKQLIREIANSDAYQQSSLIRDNASRVDPQNNFYWRMNRKRADFETLRDSILFRAGLLDETMYGPSEKIAVNESSEGTISLRRTVYAYIDRQNLPNVFRTFDFASPDAHSPRRLRTSVPQQGLFLLNSSFVETAAVSIARRVVTRIEHLEDTPSVIQALFRTALARDPSTTELEICGAFLSDVGVGHASDLADTEQAMSTGLVQLAHGLLALNELVFVD